MIYKYEAEIVNFFNRIVPEIKLATYAKESELFNAMSKIKYFPSFFFYRESTQWTFDKVYTVVEGNYKVKIIPYEQEYVGKIVVENQSTAQELATLIRFRWKDHAYLKVTERGNLYKVALRLLYIKIDEERAPDNEKGALRYVEVKWKSGLLMREDEHQNLVSGVRVYIATQNDDNLIFETNKKSNE